MASVAELIIKITGQGSASGALKGTADDIARVDDNSKKATTSAGGLKGALGGVGSVAGGVIAGAGLMALPGLLMDGAKGAAEDEASLIRLNQALDNTGASSADYASTVDDLIAKGEELAFSDGEVTDALAMLTNMTGDADTAMADLATAQDLARGANISLEQAAKLLGKTSDENTTALKKLGIELDEGATRTDALAAVQEQFGGQAQQYAESSAGAYAKFNIQMGELQETVGTALIPIFMALAPIILNVVEAAMPAFQLFVGVLAQVVAALPSEVILFGLVAAMIAWGASTLGVTTAHLALAVATLAAYAPILLLIAGIGLLVAAGYLLVTNFDTVKAAVIGAFETMRDVIMGAIGTVISFVSANWPLLLAIITGPIGIAVLAIVTYWDEIKAAFQGAIAFVVGLLTGTWATISGLLGAAVEAGQAAVSTALDAIQAVFESVVGAVVGLLTGTWSTVESLLASAAEAGQAAVEAAMNAIQAIAESVVSAVVGLLQGTWSTVESLIQIPVDAARAWVQLHLDAISLIFNTAVGAVQTLLTGTWSLVQSWIVDPVSSAASTVSTLLGNIVTWFTELPGKILNALSGFATLLVQSGTDLIDGLFDGVLAAWQVLLSFLGEIGDRIVNMFAGAGSWLYNVGRAIMQGAVDGIRSMASSLAQSAIDVAQSAIDAVGGFLGISSPSRVFYEIGQDVGVGFALGIESTQGIVGTAARELAATAETAAGGRGGSPGGFRARRSFLRTSNPAGYAGGGEYRAGSYGGSGRLAVLPTALPGSFAWWQQHENLPDLITGPIDFLGNPGGYGGGGNNGPSYARPPSPEPTYSREPEDYAREIVDYARAGWTIVIDGQAIASSVNNRNATAWSMQGMNR